MEVVGRSLYRKLNKMKRILLAIGLSLCSQLSYCQNYAAEMATFRGKYIADLLQDEHAPIRPKDIKHISFFPADTSYVVLAAFEPATDTTSFLIPTHSEKRKPYRQYGIVKFQLKGKTYSLHTYQSVTLSKKEAYKHHLFLPFKDLTNYESTYGGGRYLDLSTTDIKDGNLIIDFNKCYNPYCAYAEGYSCPIPPDENKLPVKITAGEKMYGKH